MKNLVRPIIFSSLLLGGATSLWALDIGEILQQDMTREAPAPPAKKQAPKALPEPAQAPQPAQKPVVDKPAEEAVPVAREIRREIAKGFVRMEKSLNGVGRTVELSVACPPNTAPIGGGGSNSGEPVFHIKESHPDERNGWRIVFDRDAVPGTFKIVGSSDPQPPAAYQATVFATCVDIAR